ncbi:MAG: hypothetical protein SGCHY_005143 [Lobulomycetales sp.]
MAENNNPQIPVVEEAPPQAGGPKGGEEPPVTPPADNAGNTTPQAKEEPAAKEANTDNTAGNNTPPAKEEPAAKEANVENTTPAPPPADPVVEDTPAPVVDTPAPPVNQPAPAANQPAPVVNTPAPAVNQPAPVVNRPTPVVNTPAPAANQPVAAPAVNRAPAVRQAQQQNNAQQAAVPTPTAGQSTSTLSRATPTVRSTADTANSTASSGSSVSTTSIAVAVVFIVLLIAVVIAMLVRRRRVAARRNSRFFASGRKDSFSSQAHSVKQSRKSFVQSLQSIQGPVPGMASIRANSPPPAVLPQYVNQAQKQNDQMLDQRRTSYERRQSEMLYDRRPSEMFYDRRPSEQSYTDEFYPEGNGQYAEYESNRDSQYNQEPAAPANTGDTASTTSGLMYAFNSLQENFSRTFLGTSTTEQPAEAAAQEADAAASSGGDYLEPDSNPMAGGAIASGLTVSSVPYSDASSYMSMRRYSDNSEAGDSDGTNAQYSTSPVISNATGGPTLADEALPGSGSNAFKMGRFEVTREEDEEDEEAARQAYLDSHRHMDSIYSQF